MFLVCSSSFGGFQLSVFGVNPPSFCFRETFEERGDLHPIMQVTFCQVCVVDKLGITCDLKFLDKQKAVRGVEPRTAAA